MKTLVILISIPLVKRNFKRFDINIYLNFLIKFKFITFTKVLTLKKIKFLIIKR